MKFPVILYLGWYLIIFLFQVFIQPLYISSEESLNLYQRLYWSWVSYWDGAHYASIASEGYKFPQQAFFPLWPILIKITSFIVGSFFIASFILSFIFGLLTFVLFYILAEKLIGKYYAKLALILFTVFPSTMFLHSGYTEGLFLTLTLASFILLEKKLYFWSAIFAGLTTMTRLTGVGISVALLFLNEPFRRKLFYITLSLTGVITYILFLQIYFGNGLLFLDAQKAWCESAGHCKLTFPLKPILDYGRLVVMGWVRPSLSPVFIDWVSSVIFLGSLFVVWKKISRTYFIYCLVVTVLPLFSGGMVGMVRYILIAFPVFFIFPKILKSKILFFVLCLLLFLLQLRFITLFTNRMWVA